MKRLKLPSLSASRKDPSAKTQKFICLNQSLILLKQTNFFLGKQNDCVSLCVIVSNDGVFESLYMLYESVILVKGVSDAEVAKKNPPSLHYSQE